MHQEWSSTSLSEVVTLQRGFDLPTQNRRTGPVPILGSFGLTGWHDATSVKGPGVTIGRSGGSIGVATYTTQDYWPLNTVLFVRDFHNNDPRFVYYLLKTIDFTAYNSGSAQPSLNRNYIAGITCETATALEANCYR
jgi:type I restriction enzyme S subunit